MLSPARCWIFALLITLILSACSSLTDPKPSRTDKTPYQTPGVVLKP